MTNVVFIFIALRYDTVSIPNFKFFSLSFIWLFLQVHLYYNYDVGLKKKKQGRIIDSDWTVKILEKMVRK